MEDNPLFNSLSDAEKTMGTEAYQANILNHKMVAETSAEFNKAKAKK